jgi:hypothetical protein
MGKLLELTAKLHQLTPERMEKEVLISVKNNEETATNMNTDQLFGGEDVKGKKLPPYSRRSVEVFGKQSGPMTLFDTGDFYRGFFVKADKYPITIFSNDRKTGKIADLLESKGENPDDIYGLQKKNLTEFARSYVLEDFRKFMRNFLGIR